MKSSLETLIEIGRFAIVTAIAIISGVLFDVSTSTGTTVTINGSPEGFVSSLLTIFFLIIIWFKFEIFVSYLKEVRLVIILVILTFLYIFLIAGSGVFSVDSDFGVCNLTSSKLLSVGLLSLVLSDAILVFSDVNNHSVYYSKISNNAFKNTVARTTFALRMSIALSYLLYLNNPNYNNNNANHYIHIFILLISIVFAIYMVIAIFPDKELIEEK
jgi:hypothetical protein